MNTDVHVTMCKIDSRQLLYSRELTLVFCDDLEDWDGSVWEGNSRRRGYMYTYSWFMFYDRNLYNIQNNYLPIKDKLKKKSRGGINREIGVDKYILLYIKWRTNKDLLDNTWNSTHYSVMTCMGKESKKRVDICIYKLIHLSAHLKLTYI